MLRLLLYIISTKFLKEFDYKNILTILAKIQVVETLHQV